MNSADFIAKALSIARDYKTSYIWGGLGSPITDAVTVRRPRTVRLAPSGAWLRTTVERTIVRSPPAYRPPPPTGLRVSDTVESVSTPSPDDQMAPP